jgi:hypothetical protein
METGKSGQLSSSDSCFGILHALRRALLRSNNRLWHNALKQIEHYWKSQEHQKSPRDIDDPRTSQRTLLLTCTIASVGAVLTMVFFSELRPPGVKEENPYPLMDVLLIYHFVLTPQSQTTFYQCIG